MTTDEAKITLPHLGEAEHAASAESGRRAGDMPVREFLVAGARMNLTTDQMFPDQAGGIVPRRRDVR